MRIFGNSPMLFNSFEFAIFFPLVFIIYWIFAKKIKLRNAWLLLASYIFYGWWDWRFLFLIAFSSLVDYLVGLKLGETQNKRRRKGLLIISLCVNLGLLFYFKYTNFFIESFVRSFRLFGSELNISTLQIILPVGISFYTFQTLSYTIDIYKKKLKPTKDWLAFFAFVSFFPQLVAGPIERASHLLPQFFKTHRFNYKLAKSGCLLILFGLFKKMVIADRAAIYVDTIFNGNQSQDGATYLIASLLFAFQIYCDFSGYSDIAIGLGRTMGFDLMKNFNSPYSSRSITEFWRRWHISLSTWFRDYVYIPLGGSRNGEYKTYLNLFLVFVISGLWHGAAITFIIWGTIHGTIIVLEKKYHDLVSKNKTVALVHNTVNFSHWVSIGFTFTIVCVAWVFFRANSGSQAFEIIYQIFYNFHWESLFSSETYRYGLRENEFAYLLIFIIGLFIFDDLHRRINIRRYLNKKNIIFRWSFYILAIFLIAIFGIYGDREIQTFIYFQF